MHRITLHPAELNTPYEFTNTLSDKHQKYTSLFNTRTNIWLWRISCYTYQLSPRYILPDYWFIPWLEKRRYNKMMRQTHAHKYRVSNRTPDVATLAPACPSVWTESTRHTIFTCRCTTINTTQFRETMRHSEQMKRHMPACVYEMSCRGILQIRSGTFKITESDIWTRNPDSCIHLTRCVRLANNRGRMKDVGKF
jgi:hypothetical protein